MQHRLAGLELQLAHRNHEIETLTSRIKDLDQSLTQMTNDAAASAAQADAEVAASTAQMSKISENFAVLEAALARRKEELRALHRRCGRTSPYIIISSYIALSYIALSYIALSYIAYIASSAPKSYLLISPLISYIIIYQKQLSCNYPAHITSMRCRMYCR